jgi:hypothetical protein
MWLISAYGKSIVFLRFRILVRIDPAIARNFNSRLHRAVNQLAKETIMSKSTSGSKGRSVPSTPVVASRVQGAVARTTGSVPAGSYVGRIQGAAARNFGKSGSK